MVCGRKKRRERPQPRSHLQLAARKLPAKTCLVLFCGSAKVRPRYSYRTPTGQRYAFRSRGAPKEAGITAHADRIGLGACPGIIRGRAHGACAASARREEEAMSMHIVDDKQTSDRCAIPMRPLGPGSDPGGRTLPGFLLQHQLHLELIWPGDGTNEDFFGSGRPFRGILQALHNRRKRELEIVMSGTHLVP